MSSKHAIISQKRRFSMVWIIPIVAVLLGGWMVLHNYTTRGPVITIQFANADGLIADKTHIKALSVDIGIVQRVEINPNFDGVLVTAQVKKEISPLLRADSQFWVVRPRFGATGISGLNTLLSGAYIELSPGNSSEMSKEFIGLENIPPTPANTPGVRLTLVSDKNTSLNVGEPVLYRGFNVGRVERTVFDIENRQIRSDIFIDAPYNDLITRTSRFWNASGIAVDMDTEGVRITSESMETLLIGGVSFALPNGTSAGEAVKNGDTFTLYPNQQSINVNHFHYSSDYVLLFNSSVRGLASGAPVTFRGLDIGHVVDISFDYAPNNLLEFGNNAPVPVLIRLTPASLTGEDSETMLKKLQQRIDQGIDSGLRASLKTGNLLTGSLYVSLDFVENAKPAGKKTIAGHTLIPTVSDSFDQIQTKVSTLLDKFNALTLKQTVDDAGLALREVSSAANRAESALAHLDTLLASNETQNLPANLNTTLMELRNKLSSLIGDYSAGSPVYQQLDQNLDQLQQTLYSIEQLSNQVDTQPNRLIFSKPKAADLSPEGSR